MRAAARTSSSPAPSGATRAHAQRARGAVEQRDVDPARLERRPPAQPGRLRMASRTAARHRPASRRAGSSRPPRAAAPRRPSTTGSSRSTSAPCASSASCASASARPIRTSSPEPQLTRAAERRERLRDRRDGRFADVEAAVAGRIVMAAGALERAREPERPARRRGARRRVPGQDPPEDHAKLPARSVAIASSSSRAWPRLIRSSGRRSPRLGLKPSSQRSATATG